MTNYESTSIDVACYKCYPTPLEGDSDGDETEMHVSSVHPITKRTNKVRSGIHANLIKNVTHL